MEQTKLKRFKRILLISITSLVIGIGIISSNAKVINENNPIKENIEIADTVKVQKIDSIQYKEIIKDSIQLAMETEISNYLKRQSPNAHKFIPKYLVQAGLTHNIDICFMMAQTQIETNYGTTGAGREISRRSLFGVAIRKYANYEDAINDYCRILNKSYLGKGRTEKHLMTKYTTHGGSRYAASPNYEVELSKAYKDIISKTNIQILQNEWKSI